MSNFLARFVLHIRVVRMSGPVLAWSKGWLVGFPISGLFLRRRQDVLKLRKVALTAILLMGVVVVPALAQGPLHKRINFTINVPFELKKTGAVLPPGNYVLYQISQNDPQMFALYQGDMTHAPIAMIRTTRIDYSGGRYPSKTKLLMDIDESWPQRFPTLDGFTIPGEDGWETIGGVASKKYSSVQARSVARSHR